MNVKLGSLKAVHVRIGGLPAGCLMPSAAIQMIRDHFDTDRNGAIASLRLRCSRLAVVAFAGGFDGVLPSEVRQEADALKGPGVMPVWSGFWKSNAAKEPANPIWSTGDAEHYWPDGQRINYSNVGFRKSDILRMIGQPIPIDSGYVAEREHSEVANALNEDEGPPVRKRPGRPRGSNLYPSDIAIVAKIIALCDADTAITPRRAIIRLDEQIEPKGMVLDNKVRRLQPKVTKVRPDLAERR